MDRVYESGASASPPSPPASPSAGYPTPGAPGVAPATLPGSWWHYMITEELRAVVAAAGLTPDHTNVTQLSAAIQALISAAVGGAGTVKWVAATAAPAGYLKANGALVSRTTYADLFAVIGTTFGAGDGATTFALPDLRGEFIRGYDDGRGKDAAREFGSAQADAFKSHNHTYNGTSTNVGYLAPGPGRDFQNSNALISSSTGGTETRPTNVALLPVIKY